MTLEAPCQEAFSGSPYTALAKLKVAKEVGDLTG